MQEFEKLGARGGVPGSPNNFASFLKVSFVTISGHVCSRSAFPLKWWHLFTIVLFRFFFFFFFLRKILVQYKCWKGRGFGGEEGGEKEVREIGIKEKKQWEKGEGWVENVKQGDEGEKRKARTKEKKEERRRRKRKKRREKEDKHVTTLKQMGIYKITKVSRGASRSSEAVCQQAPLFYFFIFFMRLFMFWWNCCHCLTWNRLPF